MRVIGYKQHFVTSSEVKHIFVIKNTKCLNNLVFHRHRYYLKKIEDGSFSWRPKSVIRFVETDLEKWFLHEFKIPNPFVTYNVLTNSYALKQTNFVKGIRHKERKPLWVLSYDPKCTYVVDYCCKIWGNYLKVDTDYSNETVILKTELRVELDERETINLLVSSSRDSTSGRDPKQIDKSKNTEPLIIFYGKSNLGKSYLSSFLNISGELSVYETDTSPTLPTNIDTYDVIVIGRRFPFTIDDIHSDKHFYEFSFIKK